jgi:polyhydroxyalkanoate synthesis repressor PhaR
MLVCGAEEQKHKPEGTMNKKTPQSEPIVIKKYANRRLYNTDTSSYVTLDDLCVMVKEGSEFIVYDAKSGEDLTRTILTQIIFEEESNGEHLLPINFLRQLIGFYDNSLKGFVPHYLESTMQTFTKNQEKMQGMLGMGTMGSFGQVTAQLEEIGKQNMEMFSKAFSMFAPFDAAKKK